MERIYLDYAATTYVKDEVLDVMSPYYKECFGNPSGVYESGRQAKNALDQARFDMAKCIHAKESSEIYFTSGGTESDNWALQGAMEANSAKGKHLIITAAEHHAVIDTATYLQRRGYEVTVLPVDSYGMVNAQQVKEAIREDTVLVSVIYANNEVGSINPIAQIGEVTRDTGVIFHTDAVQAVGSLPIHVQADQVDLLSLSAHKFYGPKGIGALYIRNSIKCNNFMHGGEQERRRRAGTENIPEIVGMTKALVLADNGRAEACKRLTKLRDYMIGEIIGRIPEARLNGHPKERLCNNINISFGHLDAEALLLRLDLAGIECSRGSACASGSVKASHVLSAMGLLEKEAKSTLRFTLGDGTTKEEVAYTIDKLDEIVKQM